MERILVTGATGNVGIEVIKYLSASPKKQRIFAGVRNLDRSKLKLQKYKSIEYKYFDFEDMASYLPALENIQSVFLLRPPHISDVDRYFKPLIHAMKQAGVSKIVFLSVQGAEKSKVIPHNKIEKLIIKSGIPFIFLRPSYFMQNLTTTLLKDIQEKNTLFLPAGNAKFNWIDIKNIGEVSAILLERFDEFSNQAIELTGYENKHFGEVTDMISSITGKKIGYQSPNPFSFFSAKKKDGMPTGMILVMIMLHFLPRFQEEPKISDFYEKITGKKPTSLKAFIEREKKYF